LKIQLSKGDRSGNIRVFDLELQQDLCKIEAHDSEVLCLEYSNEETYGGKSFLASASRDRLIHIFDVKQQYSFLQTMDDHSSSITAVKFVCNKSQNNLQMISCGADKSLIFRKGVETPQQSFNFVREHHVVGKTTLYDMEVDVEQNYALTACQDRMIRIYDVISGKNTSNFKGSQGDDGTLIKIALDPSGTFVATSCTDKSLYIYDYQSGECLAATSGHSELVTGLKFSQNGKNLISVSGDGCIFVWRLPVEMVNAIASKLGLPAVPLVENTSVSVAKPLQQNINNENEDNNEVSVNNNSSSTLYRFNLKSLPLWAKKQMVEELSRDPSNKLDSDSPQSQPKGRWAQRMENSQNLVVKSYLNNDAVIPYPLAKVQNTTKSNEMHNKIQSDKNGDSRYRQMTDSSSASGSFPHEDDEDFNTTDSDNLSGFQDESTYSGSTFKVNESVDSHKLRKSKSVLKRFSGIGVIPSISVPNFNELHSDDEDSVTTGYSDRSVNNRNSLYMSTENLDRIDQREKYLKNTFENLDKESDNQSVEKQSSVSQSDFLTPNRSSISSKYHSKTSTNSSSNERNSSQTNTNISPLIVKPPISKRREELTKAISEARKKLETVSHFLCVYVFNSYCFFSHNMFNK
jgi:WD40 repeat protein